MPESDRPVTPVVIKKYANRRLYDTESSIYITLDTLADMVRQGRDFVVFDAKTGDDITRQVLTQIIVEEETKGRNMLPTAFLRQLIGFYGDSLQGVVPGYLEQMMEQFASQHRKLRSEMQKKIQTLLTPAGDPAPVRDSAVVDRAMSLLTPFATPGAKQAAAAETASPPAPASAELDALRAEIERLRRELVVARGTPAGRVNRG